MSIRRPRTPRPTLRHLAFIAEIGAHPPDTPRARDALACVARLDFPDAGKLRAVAALHVGEIYYGNIGSHDRLDDACEALVAAANGAGGRDNIAVVLARPARS